MDAFDFSLQLPGSLVILIPVILKIFMYHFLNFPGTRELKTGQLIQGVVTNIDKERKIVSLSSDPDSVAKCVVRLVLPKLCGYISLI